MDDILAATGRIGGETVSIVECTTTNRLRTSLEFLLVATFSLGGWEDLG